MTLTIDDTTIIVSRVDTIAGTIRAQDGDGIDSLWITADSSIEWRADGGFSQVITTQYRLIIPAGGQAGTHIPLTFRTRDAAGFTAQRDTYVVAIP